VSFANRREAYLGYDGNAIYGTLEIAIAEMAWMITQVVGNGVIE